jgi:hypothetical protein
VTVAAFILSLASLGVAGLALRINRHGIAQAHWRVVIGHFQFVTDPESRERCPEFGLSNQGRTDIAFDGGTVWASWPGRSTVADARAFAIWQIDRDRVRKLKHGSKVDVKDLILRDGEQPPADAKLSVRISVVLTDGSVVDRSLIWRPDGRLRTEPFVR